MSPSEVVKLHRAELRDILNRNNVSNPRIFGSFQLGEDTDDYHRNILVDLTDEATLLSIGKVLSDIKKSFQVQAFLVTLNSIPESNREELIHSAVRI